MARLRTARLSATDLFSSYPNGQGALESDLATIFGFAPNVDITASPFLCDNSGRITNPLIKFKVSSESQSHGSGYKITNSSNSDSVQIIHDSAVGQLFAVRDASSPTPTNLAPTRFGIDMTSGALSGSTTQDTVQTPLIPPSGGPSPTSSTRFYNAAGQFTVPILQSQPFHGCRLVAVTTNHQPNTAANQKWTETGGFDVGGFFDETVDATKINIPTTGKYLVTWHLAFLMTTPVDGLSGDAGILVNSLIPWINNPSVRISTQPPGYYQSTGTLVSFTSGDYFTISCSNTTGSTYTSGSDSGIIDKSHTTSGALCVVRVE